MAAQTLYGAYSAGILICEYPIILAETLKRSSPLHYHGERKLVYHHWTEKTTVHSMVTFEES